MKINEYKKELKARHEDKNITIILLNTTPYFKEYSVQVEGQHVSYLETSKKEGYIVTQQEAEKVENRIFANTKEARAKSLKERIEYVEGLSIEETQELLAKLHESTSTYRMVYEKLQQKLQQETTQEENVMENTKNKIKLLYGLAEKVEKMSMEELQNTEFAKTIEDITGRNVYDKFEELELDQIFVIEDSFIEECIVQKTEKYGALSVHYFLSQINGNTEYVEFDGYENLRPVYLSDKIKDVLAIINPIIGSLEDYLWDLEYNSDKN